LLRTASSAVALAALEWAAASEAIPPEIELERYGQAALDLSTPEAELIPLLRFHPAILRGFLARLAREPPQLAGTVLAGPVGALISDDDLAQYPGLAEERLLVSVAQRRLEPQRAYDRIVDIRIAAQRSPFVDAELLGRLWPSGCPPQQIADLLGIMADFPDPDMRYWFERQIRAAAAQGTRSAGWLKLAQALTDRSLLPQLPEKLAQVVRSTTSAEQKRRWASSAVDRGDLSVFADLYADYAATDDSARFSSARDLAELLYRAEPLSTALRGCPADVMTLFCQGLQSWLASSRKDAMLAARVFTALADPGLQARPELLNQLAAAFEQVRDWHRRDLGHIRHFLSENPEAAKLFQAWRESQRGGLARKLRGGWSGVAEGR
jgi:hypothetical protein